MLSNFVRSQMRRVASLLAVLTLVLVPAYAADGNTATEKAVLSSSVSASVGTARTSRQITAAETALEKARVEELKKQQEEAEAKAAEEAKAKAEAEEKERANALLSDPVGAKSVMYSSSLSADETVKANGQALGNYRLSFYCPCAVCNGAADTKTASGTTPVEGRTIAVDSSVIPLGSRVYIEGYGTFIAEDTGGAIKGSRIDVHVSSHTRAYDLGVQYANVYLLT